MKIADRLTLVRIILAPVFFSLYMLLRRFQAELSGYMVWLIAVLWIIAIVAELTDYFDGLAARSLNQTSDVGRLLDPFADTIMQLTGFFCFVIDGILPAFLFLIVLYREFGILFIRNLMLRKGIAMGARMSGKLKTVTYIIAAALSLVCACLYRLNILEFLWPAARISAIAVFSISVVFSVLSFFDYLNVYRKAEVVR